ncbi:MAG TPA: hypothetical protein VF690_18750 [Hymenobacter sp.]|jgi:hypothetical protein
MFGVEDWITGFTTGVPHLLCPAQLVSHWEGNNAPTNGRIVESTFRCSNNPDEPTTDYDLACAISLLPQEVGTIEIGDGKAIVICGEIAFSVWVPASNFVGGYVVVPEYWTDTEYNCHDIIAEVGEEAYCDSGIRLISNGQGFSLFASTEIEADPYFEAVKTFSEKGEYGVATYFYESTAADFQLRIFRIKLLD